MTAWFANQVHDIFPSNQSYAPIYLTQPDAPCSKLSFMANIDVLAYGCMEIAVAQYFAGLNALIKR